MEFLAAGMDMDADQLNVGELAEVIAEELVLIDAELAGSAVVGVHGEVGVDADTHAQLDTLFTGQFVDELQLMQAVGNEDGMIHSAAQIPLGLTGGGVEDLLLGQAVFHTDLHFPQRGGIQPQALAQNGLYHRQKGVGLDGVEELKVGEVPMQTLYLAQNGLLVVEVEGVLQFCHLCLHGLCDACISDHTKNLLSP